MRSCRHSLSGSTKHRVCACLGKARHSQGDTSLSQGTGGKTQHSSRNIFRIENIKSKEKKKNPKLLEVSQLLLQIVYVTQRVDSTL